MPTYAVLGAGGGTGKACVETLLEQGSRVRAVVRDPEKAKEQSLSALLADAKTSSRLEVVQGDVTDPPSLRPALRGCKGAIFAASGRGYWSAQGVDCDGVKNMAEAAREAGGVDRVVLVSSALVTPKNRWNPIRMMLNTFRWGLMDAKFRGEEHLRRSGVPYTVVRPGGLTSGPAGRAKLVAGQGDRSSGRVARADVAAVCVAALRDPSARNVTLELCGTPQEEGRVVALGEQLQGIFKGLKPDA